MRDYSADLTPGKTLYLGMPSCIIQILNFFRNKLVISIELQ
jgi:hypothetical protein